MENPITVSSGLIVGEGGPYSCRYGLRSTMLQSFDRTVTSKYASCELDIVDTDNIYAVLPCPGRRSRSPSEKTYSTCARRAAHPPTTSTFPLSLRSRSDYPKGPCFFHTA